MPLVLSTRMYGSYKVDDARIIAALVCRMSSLWLCDTRREESLFITEDRRSHTASEVTEKWLGSQTKPSEHPRSAWTPKISQKKESNYGLTQRRYWEQWRLGYEGNVTWSCEVLDDGLFGCLLPPPPPCAFLSGAPFGSQQE
ncbi:hypothetical protein FQA47_010318 [Oryzias melastigma]|uniref:Uncharacterized protein n=1 Tax=Oryzias melastigma TaxID=30732 RepID=A0A834BZA0_ORYME|nr:hypothetical protein FQA47_010318 [Oryzias melastigma]